MPEIISSKEDHWVFQLMDCLKNRAEVDVTHFDLLENSKFCVELAQFHGMKNHYDPNTKTMRFFKMD